MSIKKFFQEKEKQYKEKKTENEIEFYSSLKQINRLFNNMEEKFMKSILKYISFFLFFSIPFNFFVMNIEFNYNFYLNLFLMNLFGFTTAINLLLSFLQIYMYIIYKKRKKKK